MTSTDDSEATIIAFKNWLHEHNGFLHPLVRFVSVSSGLSAVAADTLLADTNVVVCPFTLAITSDVSRKALVKFLNLNETTSRLVEWSPRQLICSYICLVWIKEPRGILVHFPYLNLLPSTDKLRTSLHFTPLELEAFKGTNIHWATIDRELEWRREWDICQSLISEFNSEWVAEFTWERYLTAATYLSSRAFPSTVLSPTPTLEYGPSSEPVLLPGIDLFNHSRESRVSWVVSGPGGSATQENLGYGNDGGPKELSIGLVLHSRVESGQEVLNNYGAKSNAELILGYGFTLPRNTDDTILLKIGGTIRDAEGKKWQVGRNAWGAETMWDEIVSLFKENGELEHTWEVELNASDMLVEMTQTLLDRLSDVGDIAGLRPEVALMREHYVEGQREILQSIIAFGREKERIAVETARLQGVELVEE